MTKGGLDSKLRGLLQTDEVQSPLREVRTRELEPFFNHMFSALPTSEGVSTLRFVRDTSANGSINREGSEAVLSVPAAQNEHAQLSTTDRTNYTPGATAAVGWTLRLERLPVGQQDLWIGGTDSSDGVGVGVRVFDIGEGTPAVTSSGPQPYAFIEKGGTRIRVPQEHWNKDTLDGSGGSANPSGADINNFLGGNIVRIDPQLYYGHGEYTIQILAKQGENAAALNGGQVLLENAESRLVDAHTFVVDQDAMVDQPNVPVRARVETNGTGREPMDLHWNAVHFSRATQEADVRLNGVRRDGTDVDTAWEPLISWQKRSGWEQVNSRAILLVVASDTDLTIDLQLGTSLNGASFDTPMHTTSSEVALEFDTSATGFSSTGERRWVGQVVGGQGNKKGTGGGELAFNLPAEQTLTLAAKADASNATVSSAVVTGSEF